MWGSLIGGMFGGGGMSTSSEAHGGPAESGFYGSVSSALAQDNSFQVSGSGRASQSGGAAAAATAAPAPQFPPPPTPQWVWLAGGAGLLVISVIILARPSR